MAIKNLKKGKAARPDGFISESIKRRRIKFQKLF